MIKKVLIIMALIGLALLCAPALQWAIVVFLQFILWVGGL